MVRIENIVIIDRVEICRWIQDFELVLVVLVVIDIVENRFQTSALEQVFIAVATHTAS